VLSPNTRALQESAQSISTQSDSHSQRDTAWLMLCIACPPRRHRLLTHSHHRHPPKPTVLLPTAMVPQNFPSAPPPQHNYQLSPKTKSRRQKTLSKLKNGQGESFFYRTQGQTRIDTDTASPRDAVSLMSHSNWMPLIAMIVRIIGENRFAGIY